jgi:hypothetical protein
LAENSYRRRWDEAWKGTWFIIGSFGKLDQDEQLRVIGSLMRLLGEPKTTDDDIRLMLRRETAIPLGVLEEGISVRASLWELLRLLTTPEAPRR